MTTGEITEHLRQY